MADEDGAQRLQSFGSTATSLANNPLGIIALFLVLVYGMATLVLVLPNSLSDTAKLLLVVFIVTFPVLVLGGFLWLVIRHNEKLYAPRDFKDESNWVRMQLETVASLAVAKSENNSTSGVQIEELVALVERAGADRQSRTTDTDDWKGRILWADDRPQNNLWERKAFEAQGYSFSLALNTTEALRMLEDRKYAAIISDMGREEGSREGYALLDEVRRRGIETPFFIYSSSGSAEHRRETFEHDGNGATNIADELFSMVLSAVRK